MKKTIFSILMAACSITIADQPIQLMVPESYVLPVDATPPKQAFFYVRFSAAESDIARNGYLLPGLGFGYRRMAGNGAADISISGIGHREHKSGRLFWTAPKATYIHYLQPDAKKSFYAGGGLAWGGIDSPERDFVGIIPSGTFGYEFAHKSSFLGFAELTLSQPALSVTRDGSFPGPIAECSVGIGF